LTFDDLVFSQRLSGPQATVHFANGYGASVITGKGSYGGDRGLYELAVLEITEDGNWDICYNSGLTDDVIGFLNEEQVTTILKQIEEL
jgi:hypothetical protein